MCEPFVFGNRGEFQMFVLIGIIFQQRFGVISRGIVDDDDFIIGIILCEDLRKKLSEIIFFISGAYDNRNRNIRIFFFGICLKPTAE